MKNKKFTIEIEPDDAVLYAQLTCFIKNICRHTRLDYIKSERNYTKHLSFDYDTVNNPLANIPDIAADEAFEKVLNWEVIKQYMGTLSVNETEVLINIYFRDMTQMACAEKMSISVRYVKQLKQSAIRKLRESMEEKYGKV